jgi:hypothetical protein
VISKSNLFVVVFTVAAKHWKFVISFVSGTKFKLRKTLMLRREALSFAVSKEKEPKGTLVANK